MMFVRGARAVPEMLKNTRVADRKSTRLNSSHLVISYAVFCLKKKTSSKDRMHFRLAPEIKDRVTRAAAIAGQGLTDFAVSALSERANEILERHESVLLNRKEY